MRTAIPNTVRHAGGDSEFIVDQSNIDGWHSLGKFEFGAGSDQWLRLDDNTNVAIDPATARIAFDSVRLTRIDEIEDDVDTAVRTALPVF